MRKPEREIKDVRTIEALLERAPVGRIATVNGRGFPVIKPVNFLSWDGKIYLHSSMQGEKVADIRGGSRVCFEIDQPIAYKAAQGPPCAATYYYRSVIVKGKATLVSDPQKKTDVLKRLMDKYQPEGYTGAMPEKILNKTAVVEISIEEITGKELLG